MKKMLVLFLTMVGFTALKAETAAEAINLKETEFDFGKIPQGKPVYHFFEWWVAAYYLNIEY